MGVNQFKICGGVIGILLMFASTSYGHNAQDERRVNVVMRTIGHQILLESGDSTSLVLPIEKVDDRYKIRFGTDFALNPEEIVAVAGRVLDGSKIENSYIIEVETCGTGEVVYSYESTARNEVDTMVVCATRVQPLGCYIVFVAFDGEVRLGELVADNGLASEESFAERKSQRNWTIVIVLFILAGVILLIRKRREGAKANTDMIQLGEYQFDKRKTELIKDGQRIELTAKEADLLLVLYNMVNETVEREVILNRVWGDEGDYVGRTLDVFVSKLRKKLEADESVKIVNIRGVGYKLVTNI